MADGAAPRPDPAAPTHAVIEAKLYLVECIARLTSLCKVGRPTVEESKRTEAALESLIAAALRGSPPAGPAAPWQDIEIVVEAASVLFETVEGTKPEKDSAITNVKAWLAGVRAGPAPEPSEEARRAAFRVLWGKNPEYESAGDVEGEVMCARDEERWCEIDAMLSEAYAMDGVRASRESPPKPIRVGGGFWRCEKCGEEYHSSIAHECPLGASGPDPRPLRDRILNVLTFVDNYDDLKRMADAVLDVVREPPASEPPKFRRISDDEEEEVTPPGVDPYERAVEAADISLRHSGVLLYQSGHELGGTERRAVLRAALGASQRPADQEGGG